YSARCCALVMQRKLAAEPQYSDVSLPPVERVRALGRMGRSVQVEVDLSPHLYLRWGRDMERMAAAYHQEEQLENAYVLYNKFITLFVEKLPLHRDYHECSSSPEKVFIMKKLQEVAFPRRDELKKKLEEKYNREYAGYLNNKHQQASPLAVTPGALLLADGSLGQGQWLEQERRRVDDLRRRQIESEQFIRFEEQLRRQERANQREEGAGLQANLREEGAGPHESANQEEQQRLEGLRRVVLPRDLTLRFLRLAESNTNRGLETCGVLCGRLAREELVVTHVVVPKQTSGPDFCDMENVEELFCFQDQQNLLTLGWIHTHPTQTAFLSSVDLHTHCSFQLMLPEAIAVVCAPRHNDCAVFRLTGPGISAVSRCRLKGFHPHSRDPPLFSVCKHVLVRDCAVMLLDLR
uniref:MPN domain-containing protein n=1 Tax=Periophthalmus magnuspinnatus TaxID=409849 RepID=A0A3B4AGS1_9GOBI